MSTTKDHGLTGIARSCYLAVVDGGGPKGLTTNEVAKLTNIDPRSVASAFTDLRRKGKITPCTFRLSEGKTSGMRAWAYNLPERVTEAPANAPAADDHIKAPAWRRIQMSQNGQQAPQEAAAAPAPAPQPPAAPEPVLTAPQPAPQPSRIDRDIVVLITIANRPGCSALDLAQAGLERSDGRRLVDLEERGLVAYRNGGWHLTGKGDARLLSNS